MEIIKKDEPHRHFLTPLNLSNPCATSDLSPLCLLLNQDRLKGQYFPQGPVLPKESVPQNRAELGMTAALQWGQWGTAGKCAVPLFGPQGACAAVQPMHGREAAAELGRHVFELLRCGGGFRGNKRGSAGDREASPEANGAAVLGGDGGRRVPHGAAVPFRHQVPCGASRADPPDLLFTFVFDQYFFGKKYR